jgi:serine protease Do
MGMEDNNIQNNQNNINNTNFNEKEINKKNRLIVAFVVTVIVSAIAGCGSLLLFFHMFPQYLNNTVTNITKSEKEVTVNENGIADAVEKEYDAVTIVENFRGNKLYATGTGFIFKKEGNTYYLLTNFHVINGGSLIKIKFTDGTEVPVNVVGGDQFADVAVLSYESEKDLTVSSIGNSSSTRVGDTVFAIGAPIDSDVFSWTVTRGILSGKDREVSVSVSGSVNNDWIMKVLQTDAAINSGNSGGPLCNSNGEVIGITNMKLSSSSIEGMGFAIPIEDALGYADQIISGKGVQRPYLGVSMADANNSYYAYRFGYGTDQKGVLLVNVEEGSSADKAGLKSGDIVIGLNDEEIKDTATFRYKLYKYEIGTEVKIKYLRNNKEYTTDLKLVTIEN